MPSADILFTPFPFGKVTLANRLAMAPMTRTRSPGGVPGADVAAYYRRRVEGGLGLIISEGTWIDHHAAANEENVPRFYGDDALAGWSAILREVHGAGGRMIPQLWHTGLNRRPKTKHLYAMDDEDLSRKASPSGIASPGEQIGEGMDEKEAEAIIAAYADAAATAERLGFDGAELHGAHGYLIDQFLWSETNRRSDRYGADRTRFAVEVVKACRARVSAHFPIVFRFSQWKLQDYDARLAQTPQELEAILAPLADAGVDVFHASMRRYWEPEFAGSPLNLAGWAKSITGRPSMAVGSIGLAVETKNSMIAEDVAYAGIEPLLEMMERGDFDLAAIGRAVISEPDWANKIRGGAGETIRPFNSEALATLV